MKFVRIFAKDHPVVFALQMVGAKQDVLTKALSNWRDTLYLYTYFEDHWSKIKNAGKVTPDKIESAVNLVLKDVNSLHAKLKSCAENYNIDPTGEQLESLFQNLHHGKGDEFELRESKAKLKSDPNWIRLYGIKIEANCYIITGGLIKLTDTIQDMGKVGNNELKNIRNVREFLMKEKINNKKKLLEYIHEKEQK